MQNSTSQQVIGRFFEALDLLIASRAIRGKKTFVEKVGYNRRNFYALEHDYTSDRFNVGWLTVLVEDYGVSAEWLLTGHGGIFDKQ